MDDHSCDPASWAIEQYKAIRGHEMELNRATAAFEHASLQPLFLLNGGALVAFLTLIGAIWKESQSIQVGKLEWPLSAWSAGLIFAAAATAIAYRSQRSFTVAVRCVREQIEFQHGLRNSGPNRSTETMLAQGRMLQNLAMYAGAVSLVLFLTGVFLALGSLK